MKNLRGFAEKAEIVDFVGSLWQTELFQKAHTTPGSYVRGVVDEFAYLPRLFAESSNDQLERAHFSTWWGVIMLRDDYTNPYIHDLYLLHEMYHAGKMPYIPGISRDAFAEKMQRNELEASVMSEIQVYFEMPELRALSFPHPIYADQFLENDYMVALWKQNRSVARETIRSIRRDIMTSKPEHLMSLAEIWVRKFTDQNTIWALIWTARYSEVEYRMAELQRMAADSRALALSNHIDWLNRECAQDPIDNVPFRPEAENFEPFVAANKRAYAKAMAEAEQEAAEEAAEFAAEQEADRADRAAS